MIGDALSAQESLRLLNWRLALNERLQTLAALAIRDEWEHEWMPQPSPGERELIQRALDYIPPRLGLESWGPGVNRPDSVGVAGAARRSGAPSAWTVSSVRPRKPFKKSVPR